MSLTQQIAEFIAGTGLSRMPAEVVDRAKNHLTDTLGVALAGSVHPLGKMITAFVQRFNCQGTAGVIGSNVRTSSPLAALANGTISHVLDYDDFRAGSQGHPSAVLVSTVLSLGEEAHASGADVVEAYVMGLEIWTKVSIIAPRLHLRGWHPTGVLGTIGAASAASRLLKLSADQTRVALGIAASESAGLLQNFGTTTKPLHAGNAAKNGIVSALLARDGFTASKDIFDGDDGFIATFSGAVPNEAAQPALGLGAPFSIVSPGLTVKNYSACGGSHRSLDAMMHLIRSHDIRADEVESVRCLAGDPLVPKALFYSDPCSALEARFSMQFAMAIALIDRKFGLAQLTDAKVNDPRVKELMRRVSLTVNPRCDQVANPQNDLPDSVEVTLKNGKVYSREELRVRGDPRNPLTPEELLAKYRDCAGLALGKQSVEHCLEQVQRLDKMEDISELMQTIAA